MKRYKDLISQIMEDTGNVAFHDFVLQSNRYPNHLFCFYEGKEDDAYYGLRIRNFYKKRYQFVICNNKKNLLKLYNLITNRSHYNKYKKAYFVDRDFDESLNNKDIFETPCYSIENLYTTKKVLSEILKHLFQLNKVSTFHQNCLKLFEERQSEFIKAVTLINFWLFILRSKATKKHVLLKFSLDHVLPNGYVSISLEKVSQKYNLKSIRSKFPSELEMKMKEIRTQIKKYKSIDLQKFFRGKYQLEFFLKFLRLLIEDSANSKKYIPNKINLDLNRNNFLISCSLYAETPPELKKYLRKF